MRRSHRRQEGLFLVEGERAITDAMARAAHFEEVFVDEDSASGPIATRAVELGVRVSVVGPKVIEAISDSSSPQGSVAIARSPLSGWDALEMTRGLCLVLAEVADPGNLGTLLRTAAAASVDAVILTRGTVDVLNPKTVRAAAAALFEVTCISDVEMADAATKLHGLGYQMVGTSADAPSSIYTTDLTQPCALVLGNEAWGLPAGYASYLDRSLSIPMPGEVESLNVAVAGGVILFETLRQRSTLERTEDPASRRLSSSGFEEATVE